MGNCNRNPREYLTISGISESVCRDEVNGIYSQRNKEESDGRPVYRLEDSFSIRMCFKGGYWRIYGTNVDGDEELLASILSSTDKFPRDHNNEDWAVNCRGEEWKNSYTGEWRKQKLFVAFHAEPGNEREENKEMIASTNDV